MHTCIHFCSPPSGISGSAPEWEWINNTKVWLDVWDPDSGFHFPDREPGRCPFRLPSNSFLENWNNQDEAPNTQRARTQQKGSTPFSSPSSVGKLIPRRHTAGPRRPDVLKVDGQFQHYVTVTGHFMCLKHEIEATCFPLWGGLTSSHCIPMKLMPSLTPSTKHLDQALIVYSLSRN